MKIAIFPLRLLLFYIVYIGGKSRRVRAQPRPQQSPSRKKEKPFESDDEWNRLLFAASLFAAAQEQRDSPANQSKMIAFENAWNQAEERKDAKALDVLMDNSLAYADYDGTLKTKADFLAIVKAAGHRPEQQITESMNAHV